MSAYSREGRVTHCIDQLSLFCGETVAEDHAIAVIRVPTWKDAMERISAVACAGVS